MIPEFKVTNEVDWKKFTNLVMENKGFKKWGIDNVRMTIDMIKNGNISFSEGSPEMHLYDYFNDIKDSITSTKIKKVKYNMGKLPQEQSLAARNNMLIDIAYSILTNKDTSSKILNPGSFDKIKRISRIADIVNDRVLYDKFKALYNLTDDKITDYLLKAPLSVVDDFIKDNREYDNPLGLDNFVYFHNQNMTGGILIGAYANNGAATAKYQGKSLAIKDENKYYINGRWIKSLTNIMSDLGERITKNNAEFQAASVDNGKDPVLASLMQNINVAKITGFMIRAGMSIDEIGLMFNQPYVRRVIMRGLTPFDDFSELLLAELKKPIDALEKMKASTNFEDFLTKEYTNEYLLNNIVGSYKEKDERAKIEYIRDNVYSAMLMAHIASLASDLSNVTRISRADSPNAAAATTIAGVKNQIHKVNLVHKNADFMSIEGIDEVIDNNIITPNMSKDILRSRLMNSEMPMLQAFYSLGIEFAAQISSPYFIQSSDYVNRLTEKLYLNSPRDAVSDDTLNKFYNELVTFGLTKTTMFGDDGSRSYEEKRNYYLNSYPNEFIKVKSLNSDIAKLGIMKKLSVKNGQIVMNRSARLSTNMRELLMRDLDTLLYMDNPVANQLAVDLFAYSFYKDGFNFGPNNYGYFFSTNFISNFPEFIETLREMKYNLYEGSYFDKYLEQFYANHYTLPKLLPEVTGSDNDPVTVVKNDLIVSNMRANNYNTRGTSLFEYIVYGKTLYRLDPSRVNDNTAVYVEVPTTTTNTVVYNANKTIDRLTEGIETQSKVRYKGSEENTPQLIESSFEGIDFDSFGQSLSALESGPYSEEEGQNQLDNPMCK